MRIPPRPTTPTRATQPSASSVANPSPTVLPSASVRRDPKQAVDFTTAFHQRLDLPAARLKEKLALLRESPAALFRMMPALFHEDLRRPWAAAARLLDRPAPQVLAVGDMHVGNLGTFREPDGGGAVWGLNDFDQAAIASPEVDLTRLATSALLSAREAGLSSKEQAGVVEAFAQAYFREVGRLAEGGDNPGAFLTKKEAKGGVDDLIKEASDRSPREALGEDVQLDAKGGPRFKCSDTLRPVPAAQRRVLDEALAAYENGLEGAEAVERPLRVLDWAQRLDAGGSSYGLSRYYALVRAADPKQPPVQLELKELLAPSLVHPPVPADGQAVVEHQRELGCGTNPLTGSTRAGGRAFLVREREPEKAHLEPKAMNTKKELVSVFEQAAVVLARAHGGTRSQAEALADWVGRDAQEATKRLVGFARGYADQTVADWKALRSVA